MLYKYSALKGRKCQFEDGENSVILLVTHLNLKKTDIAQLVEVELAVQFTLMSGTCYLGSELKGRGTVRGI